jgi:hypothetical protein
MCCAEKTLVVGLRAVSLFVGFGIPTRDVSDVSLFTFPKCEIQGCENFTKTMTLLAQIPIAHARLTGLNRVHYPPS